MCQRFLLLLFCCLSPLAFAQVESVDSPVVEEAPVFDVDAINFASTASEKSRLDVFVRVPYSTLGFFQEDEQYVASYEISLALVNPEGKSVDDKSWTEEISTTFSESTAPGSYSLVRHVFEVPPGSYTLEVLVRDLEIRTPMRITREVTLREFPTTGFALSGIMLIGKLSQDQGRKVIIPNVSSNVGSLPEGFHAFLEGYNMDTLDGIRTRTEIMDQDGKQVFVEEREHTLKPGRNQVFIKVDNSQLSMGDYALRVHAVRMDGSGTLAVSEKPFIVRWKGIPRAAKDLELAIEQLQYIENPGEVDHILEAKDEPEKRKRFMEFWQKRDPTSSTARNEKMEEYYTRVDFANRNFAHYIEGWRTDMGMVYIIFGSPDNVDRHPFDIDSKPYEIWSYYELNHQFTFVDQTGFGDYRLTTPIWEVWQRPK
jgi:GWxTD domain-containing protein